MDLHLSLKMNGQSRCQPEISVFDFGQSAFLPVATRNLEDSRDIVARCDAEIIGS
jgi:hypothetical protein